MTLTNLGAENYDGTSTLPSATGTNAVAIGINAEATLSNAIAFGRYASASGGNATAIGDSAIASGTYAVALGQGADATNTFALALGNNAQAVTGNAVAIGYSYASGSYGFAANIANNTSSYGATGTNSVAIGYQAKATSTDAFSLGTNSQATSSQAYGLGQYGVASNNYAYCLGGFSTASGYGSYAIGTSIAATSKYSVAMGRRAKTTVEGQYAFSNEWFSAQGDSQTSIYVLRSDTTDATAEALTTNNATAASTNQIVAANDTCITFSGTVVAMQNGASSYGSWEIRGLLVNDGGTTTLPVFNISEIGSSGWKVNLYADNTNNALKVQVTGVAATNIRWVATIHTSEVTYA